MPSKYSKTLSENELLEAISFEYYLNNKRAEKEKFHLKYEFGKCKICHDDATGIHYGANTCEGCKGFFKRSIVRYKKYKCQSDQNCTIHPKRRKKCKYCRWQSCIRAGMSLTAVRTGRIPNSMKKIEQKQECSIVSQVKNENFIISFEYIVKLNKLDHFSSFETHRVLPESYLSEKYLIKSNQNQIFVLSLLRDKSYQLYREQTQEFNVFEQRALKLIDTGYQPSKYNYTKEFLNDVLKKDLAFVETHASSMMTIVNELPGFHRLSQRDINGIINEHFFPVMCFRTFKLFINGEYFFWLDEETQLNKELFSKLGGEALTNFLFDFYFYLKELKLTEQELGLMVPYFLSLLNFGLEGNEILKEINEYYSRALYYQFTLNKRSIEFLEKFTTVVLLAPKLNKLCREVNFDICEFS